MIQENKDTSILPPRTVKMDILDIRVFGSHFRFRTSVILTSIMTAMTRRS